MHEALIKRYIELQTLMLTVIAPHWCEHIWLTALQKPTTVQCAHWPVVPATDAALTAARDYARATQTTITAAEGAQVKRQAKGKVSTYDPKQDKVLHIYCALKYPSWQDKYIDLVRDNFNSMSLTVDMKSISTKIEKSEAKKAMGFVQSLKKSLEEGTSTDEVFARVLPYDEVSVLKEMLPALVKVLYKCTRVEIIAVEEGGKAGTVVGIATEQGKETSVKAGDKVKDLSITAEAALPGSPTFFLENV